MNATLAELPLRIYYAFHPSANVFWDGVDDLDVPAPVPPPGLVAAGTGPGKEAKTPSPAPLLDLPLLRVCKTKDGGCGAHIGARCTTADGKVTRFHAARKRRT